MLPSKIALDVVTPERLVLRQEVDEVVLPGSEGYLGVRPGHTPLLTGLGVGVLSWRSGAMVGDMAVSLGYAEILADRVSVLAETAETATEIDIDRARSSKDRALQRVARAGESDLNLDRARAALERATVRLRVAERKSSGDDRS